MKIRLKILLFYILLVGTWQFIATRNWLPDYLFPAPSAVARRLYELVQDGALLPSIRATLMRMLIGFGSAAAIGLALGILMGMRPLVNRCFHSLLVGLQTLPSVAWVPIALLLFGLRDTGIYFVIIMSAVAGIAIATADGIAHIPPLFIRAAQTLGTPRRAMWYRVILPAALPSIVTGLKLGWTLGWHGAVSAELIKSSVGLGFLLCMGRELNDMAQVIGMMLVTILAGLLVDRLVFMNIETRIRHRWGLQRISE